MKKFIIVIFILSLIVNSCRGGEENKMQEKEKPALDGRNILMVIAHQNFRDEEFSEPHSIFLDQGAEIVVVSTDTAEAVGMLGMKVKPDKLIRDINPLDFDAIILIGGSGSSELWENETLHEHLRTAFENEKIIGAICLSPVTLIKAGILTGKSATCYETPEVVKIFKENNVELTGKSVDVTGKIITANGPTAAKEYAEKIAKFLK